MLQRPNIMCYKNTSVVLSCICEFIFKFVDGTTLYTQERFIDIPAIEYD